MNMSLEFWTCSIIKIPLKYSNSDTKPRGYYSGNADLLSDISSSELYEELTEATCSFISGFSYVWAEFQSALIFSCIILSCLSMSKVSMSSLVNVVDIWPGLSLLQTLSSQDFLLGSISYSTKQLMFEIFAHLLPVNALPPNFAFSLSANETFR